VSPKTLAAYQAWRKAANAGYLPRVSRPSDMARTDAKIHRLKQRYERALCAEKGRPYTPD